MYGLHLQGPSSKIQYQPRQQIIIQRIGKEQQWNSCFTIEGPRMNVTRFAEIPKNHQREGFGNKGAFL